ncbi:uncharacterized protein RHOBADRAFT_54338 [Rhodotorula graminis WP1]|uniref:Sulfhydryl oxidase n=1 Tax=Rhodotorula graminis (strain WP1) TaxID=578459 RepID=A0A194S1Q9_RHOGW|nr:uncharacterized protein RHOBADRAFT_54338 [Rhodotorula graminis WP1]KPV74532.1 hypothetical protein RHOBADRAFT_54338 [Rhodotorula graminis WP1]
MSTTPDTQQLAPGVILGPDGKPCKPCMAFRSFAGVNKKAAAQQQGSSSSSGGGGSSTASSALAGGAGSAAAAAATAAAPSTYAEPVLPADCPPDVERLGRHTWTFLHTTASYFPPQPSPHQKSAMLSLLRALPTLYPCGTCADHLGTYLSTHPPEPEVDKGRDALERWLCGVHNEVNERLGKDRFECGDVPQRWRDGWADGRCDP